MSERLNAFVAFSLILVATLSLSSRAPAKEPDVIPHAQDRPPNDPYSPAEAIRKMVVPEGFHVELVASEPDIVNPVAMTFDERGRIWVTESLEYPRRDPGPGRDRVKVLEDTDNDGKADRFTVFAEGLNIPSGIAVGHGGVWVANSPDILFLRDTDGDGKADHREVVVTGFGRSDTHELPNSLTWGPDGWLYGWNGVFNMSRVEYRGKTYKFTCAIFRIHPRTREFEVFCEGTSNPWGIAWDPEGSAFASACVIDHLWHLVETGYYHRQGGPYPPFTWKLDSIVAHKHQKAAYCGIHYFDSDAYPPEYRGKLYMGNIHGNCINVDQLERHGSTYQGIGQPDFLTANDAWFMPVSQKTGPDGCLYILDWYDRYHCYQDASRDPAGIDRLKGRLYRVRYKDSPRINQLVLNTTFGAALLTTLNSPNLYVRETVQRLLTERLQQGQRNDQPALERFVFDETQSHKGRMHALWALVGGGPLNPEFHRRVLEQGDPVIRAWGVRAAGNQRTVAPAVRETVVRLAQDRDASVVLQVVIAAGKVEGIEPMPVWMDILSRHGEDPLIPHIVWQNLYPRLESDGASFARILGGEKRLDSAGLLEIVPRALDVFLSLREPHANAVAGLLKRMVDSNDETAVRRSFDVITARFRERRFDDPWAERMRSALRDVLAQALATNRDGALRSALLIADAYWRDGQGLGYVRELLAARGKSEDLRLDAFQALAYAMPAEALDRARELFRDPALAGSIDFRGKILGALGSVDLPKVSEAVLELFPRMEPELKPRAIELLTQRPYWGLSLMDAIARNTVPASAVNVNQIRKLLASKDAELIKRVTAQWGTVREQRNPGREQVIDGMRAMLRRQTGDARAGEQVFKKVCAQCHKIYGEGQDVGPDLTASGRASFEQLLSNVFDPSLVIGSAYQATMVATSDGRVLTGLLVEQSPDRVVLKTQGGKVETIPRSDVEQLKVSALSLMPEGMEKQLKPHEIVDLFAFLALDRSPSDPNAKPIPGAGAGRR